MGKKDMIPASVGCGPYGLIALSVGTTKVYIGDNGIYDEDGKKVYLRQLRQAVEDREEPPSWAASP